MDGSKILGKWYCRAEHMGNMEQEALMANPRGCRGVVTRVPWIIHDSLLNDGLKRVTALICANCYNIATIIGSIYKKGSPRIAKTSFCFLIL